MYIIVCTNYLGYQHRIMYYQGWRVTFTGDRNTAVVMSLKVAKDVLSKIIKLSTEVWQLEEVR